MSNRQTIFISSYPKSGSTWLTRLLGDILNSPTGGCMPEQDSKEVATEGQDRPGLYVVRKGHFVLIDDDGSGAVVPRPHRLAWKRLTNECIVFLVRDPRGICVSGAYHWRVTREQFLDRMIRGEVARCGRWDRYVETWLDFHIDTKFDTVVIIYENLVNGTLGNCRYILSKFKMDFDEQSIKRAIEAQSFASRSTQIGDNEQELRRNNMRKGVVGDWRNHFTQAMNERIWNEFGWMMERLGYSK